MIRFVVHNTGASLQVVIVTLTVAPSSRCTAAAHELTHKGNINQIIATRDREIYQFNVAQLSSPVVDTLGLTRTGPILQAKLASASTR